MWACGWRAVMAAGRGSWSCTGWAVRARPAWRWSTRTGTWVRWGWRGRCPPGTRRCWRLAWVSWPPSWGCGRRRTRGDPVASVHAVLATSPAGWLLVFDDCPGPAAVQQVLPPAGDGRVLITSRNALWPPGQAVEVPVLGPGVAAGFLAERTGDPDGVAAPELAKAVGGLPLALEQAAAYIQATGGSLAGYLASFRQRRRDPLARGEPTGYSGTVATTWALAFAQLEHSGPAAAGLLRLLAFCAPEAVPLRLLLQSRPGMAEQLSPEVAGVLGPLLEDELAAGDAVAALRQFSLVRPAGDRAVLVHRLVQAVTFGPDDRSAGQLLAALYSAGSARMRTADGYAP